MVGNPGPESGNFNPESEDFNPDRQELEDALRMEIQAVNPEEQRRCNEVGRRVSDAFIEVFGSYLNPEQIEELRSSQIIVPKSTDLIKRFYRLYDDEELLEPEKILNGIRYLNYNFVNPDDNQDLPRGVFDIPGGIQYGEGRITVVAPIYVEGEKKQYLPYPDMLITERKAEIVFMEAADTEEEAELIDSYESTQYWADTALHEKVHIATDRGKLALPIDECATRYYANKTFRARHWRGANYQYDLPAINYWVKLVKKAGDDLHRLAFGNLEGERAQELRTWLYQQFTPEAIAKIFPDFRWKTKRAR